MRFKKLGVLGLGGMVLAAVSWLPGCSAEPQAVRAGAGSGGTGATGASGAAGMTMTPYVPMGGSAGQTTSGAGSGGGGGDVTAGGAGSGGSAGSAGGGGADAGGSGGTAGTGGGGSGGLGYGGFNYGGTQSLPDRTCAEAEGPDDLLDDFEDSNTSTHAVDGRNGSWFAYNDGTVGGTFTGTAPVAGEGRSNSVAWCSTASGYTTWGANIVLKPLSPVCGYDASIYTGVCFWAKGVVDAGGPIEFGIGTADTVPIADGGVCTPVSDCWYGYMANIDGLMENSYQEYCFTWAELTQWVGTPAAAQHELDPASIVQMEWKFTARGAEAPTNGQLCIDDVRFMTE